MNDSLIQNKLINIVVAEYKKIHTLQYSTRSASKLTSLNNIKTFILFTFSSDVRILISDNFHLPGNFYLSTLECFFIQVIFSFNFLVQFKEFGKVMSIIHELKCYISFTKLHSEFYFMLRKNNGIPKYLWKCAKGQDKEV